MPFMWNFPKTRACSRLFLSGAVVALAAHATALSQEPVPRAEPAQATHRHPECYCRAMGSIFSVGTQICMNMGSGAKLYRCGMDQNVTSWQSDGTGCPQS